MKLKYRNPTLPDGVVVISYGLAVKNGDVHDFARFGEKQKHFELKALSTKEWERLDENGNDIEDAVIVEEPKRRGRQRKDGNA